MFGCLAECLTEVGTHQFDGNRVASFVIEGPEDQTGCPTTDQCDDSITFPHTIVHTQNLQRKLLVWCFFFDSALERINDGVELRMVRSESS